MAPVIRLKSKCPQFAPALMNRLAKSGKSQPDDSASQRGLVDSFFQSTTLHGLLQVWSAETKCLKVIFLWSFIICNGAAIYYCYKHVNEFLTDPARASYLIEEAEKLDLPDLTICGFGRFNTQRLHSYNVTPDLANYLQYTFIPNTPEYNFSGVEILPTVVSLSDVKKFEGQLDQILNDTRLTFDQLMENVSVQCADMITYCVTNNPRSRYNCCKEAKTIMTDRGQCYRIKGVTQFGSGYGMGLTVLLKLPVDLYSTHNYMPLNDGIMVKLTEQGKGYDFDAMFIPTGAHALLSLRATLMQLIDDPRQYRCSKIVEANYTTMMCITKCVMLPMQKICRCRYIGTKFAYPKWDRYRICRPRKMISCGYKQLEKLNDSNPLLKECKNKCRPPCEYWQYQTTLSIAKFPSKQLGWRHFPGNTTEEKQKSYETLRETELILEMFHDKLEYTRIRQFESVSIYSMIAYIGGQLGLWMGGSVLSFVHVLVFLCLWIRAKANNAGRLKSPADSPAEIRSVPLTSSLKKSPSNEQSATNNNLAKCKSVSFDKAARNTHSSNQSSPDEFDSSSESWNSMLNVSTYSVKRK